MTSWVECEFPLCDVQVSSKRYCTKHQRLFEKQHAEHQAVLLATSGVTKENIVNYWIMPENVKQAIRMENKR